MLAGWRRRLLRAALIAGIENFGHRNGDDRWQRVKPGDHGGHFGLKVIQFHSVLYSLFGNAIIVGSHSILRALGLHHGADLAVYRRRKPTTARLWHDLGVPF